LAYNDTIGKELGLVGSRLVTEWDSLKPTLSTQLKPDGRVVISFSKGKTNGIHLFCRRGSQTEFEFLGVDTASPYYDTRPNENVGQNEKREYYAVFFVKDELVGDRSDIVSVVV
jgi:hypothetical protein